MDSFRLQRESGSARSTGTTREKNRRRGVTARAVVIAFLLVPPNTLFLVKGVITGTAGAGGVIFFNTVAVLLVLALLNRLLKRWRPHLAFSSGELLTIYAVLTMSTGLVGGPWSVGGVLPAVMTYPFWFADPQNKWQELLWPYFPTWLIVQDRAALEGFWAGESNPYLGSVVKAWMAPAFWWATFMGAVMWVCLCLNSIVRRRWADEERLPFPFVTVPVQLVEERYALFRSRLWWIGISCACLLGVWNAVSSVAPSLPRIPLNFNFQPYLVGRWPWESMTYRFQYISWEPFWVSLCYLIPADLIFSLLVFELMWLGEYVLSWHYGWAARTGFPFIDHQTAGAAIGLALAFFWLDRRYFIQVIRKFLGLRSALREEGREAFGYRSAMLGALLGFGYAWWFWARAGVPGWILLVFLGLYFAIAMTLSRVRAQVGSPMHELYGVMPDMILRTALGTHTLGGTTLAMFHLLSHYLIGDQDNTPVPAQLETLKMAEGGRMERRRIAVALALVAPVTVLFYFWAYVHVCYQIGIGTAKADRTALWVSRWAAEVFDTSLRQPAEMSSSATMAMGFGLVATLTLLFLKLRFVSWPLHPIAFPIANSWMMHYFTLVFAATWLLKSLLMRYGGLRAHRAALPFFLGLLVGDLSVSCLRAIIFLAFHIGA